jgi:hypothetical protein
MVNEIVGDTITLGVEHASDDPEYEDDTEKCGR